MHPIKSSDTAQPFFSIVVPVYNGEQTLGPCLQAIAQSSYRSWELIVVDDGSTDQSATLAAGFPARIVKLDQRQGAGVARNRGAKLARGKYLYFVDADCEVYPHTLEQMAMFLADHPEADAAFGSYDDDPKAKNFVAQYRNLLHHYVHQTGETEAVTFWTGCGVVRTALFRQMGGFNARLHALEDIDLGYRIRQLGGRIYLVKHVQVKHYKSWNLISLVKTDVLDRGIPWTKLLLSYPSGLANDLNLKVSSRISVVAAYALLLLVSAGLLNPYLGLLAAIPAGILLQLNWDLYQFFYCKRGGWFALKSIALHWFYYFYCGVSYVAGVLLYQRQGLRQKVKWVRTFKGI